MSSLRVSSLPLLIVLLAGCASKETIARRDREDDQRSLEYARERGQREAAEYNEFLAGYAHGLGKTPSQLTAGERAEAQRIYGR